MPLNARVVAEPADNPVHVILEARPLVFVFECDAAGRLDPAAIVDARLRRALFAEVGERVPATVEEDEHGADAVVVKTGDIDQLTTALRLAAQNRGRARTI